VIVAIVVDATADIVIVAALAIVANALVVAVVAIADVVVGAVSLLLLLSMRL